MATINKITTTNGTTYDIETDWSNVTSKPTIPTKVSDLTNDSGFTSNVGTVTGIKMNGASKGTSGVVDLGTVITAHQSLDAYTPTANLADVALNGEYGSLLNLPVVPTVVSELPNDAGYLDSTSFITTGGQTIVDSGALVSFSTSWNVQSVGGATNAYTFYLEVIETSVNTDAKTSAVTYKVYAKGNNNYSYNNFSAPTVTIKVDGTSLGAVNVTSISTTKTLVATKSNTVTHNADGTKTISVQVTYANAETSYLPKPHTSSAYSVTLSTFTETEGVDIAGIRTPNGKVYNLADTYAREQIQSFSGFGVDLLWSQTAPSSYAGTTINVNLTNYKAIVIVTQTGGYYNYAMTFRINGAWQGTTHRTKVTEQQGGRMVARYFTVNETSIVVGDGYRFNTYGSSTSTTDNAQVIPVAILGVH